MKLKLFKYNQKGFTLIELLIVIAIIGILSSVVLTSVGSARTQAFDTKVKGQLSNIRSAAEIYFSSRYNYGTSTYSCTGGMFADTASGLSALSISGNYPVGENAIICNSNGTAYAVSDNLLASTTFWCVDSYGASKQESTSLGSSTVCS